MSPSANGPPHAPTNVETQRHQPLNSYQNDLGGGSYGVNRASAPANTQNIDANFRQYDNASMYSTANGSYQHAANSQASQDFDLEPTPIGDMAPYPSQNATQGYVQQQQHHHHHHHWYQR